MKRGSKLFSVKGNLFIQGKTCESKNRNKILQNLMGKIKPQLQVPYLQN